MLDAILQIIDRLIQLTEYREDRKRSAFENHVNPIFNELKTIYDDYRALLIDTQKLLEQPETTFLDIVHILRERREDYQRIRSEVARYTNILTNTNNLDKDIQKFATTAIEVIQPKLGNLNEVGKSLGVSGSRISQLLSQFLLIISIENKNSIRNWEQTRQLLVSVLECSQSDLEVRWNAVCNEYYHLRLTCLK